MAEDRAQPAMVVFGTAERRRENLAEVAVPVAQALLVRLGQGGEVTVDAGQHVCAGPVEPVQVGQAGAQPGGRVADLGPGAGVGELLPGDPVRGARAEQRVVVGEVPVDGQPGYPGLLRDGGDGGRGRPDAAVQGDGGLHDALPRLVHLLGPAAHPVWPRIQ